MIPILSSQPFHDEDQNELFKIIRLGKYNFDAKYWSGISDQAKTLITHLLDVDPSSRYTATKALQSDWIRNMEESMLAEHNLRDSLDGISKESTRLKTLVKSVQWLNREKKHMRNLSSLTLSGTAAPDVASLGLDP